MCTVCFFGRSLCGVGSFSVLNKKEKRKSRIIAIFACFLCVLFLHSLCGVGSFNVLNKKRREKSRITAIFCYLCVFFNSVCEEWFLFFMYIE